MLSVTQPTTMITDYVLAAAGLAFGALLLRSRGGSKPALLWSIGFFAGGAAAAIGGTYHGFALYFDEATHRALWNSTAGLIGASAGFMISAGILGLPEAAAHKKRWLKAGLWVTLAGLAIQQLRLSPNLNFNHNDLYHCVQTVALFLFYKGAKSTCQCSFR